MCGCGASGSVPQGLGAEALRSDVPLREREHEQAVVAGLVDAARAGEGAALVTEGPAGIGKTRLLASTCRSAAERQLTVLRARGR